MHDTKSIARVTFGFLKFIPPPFKMNLKGGFYYALFIKDLKQPYIFDKKALWVYNRKVEVGAYNGSIYRNYQIGHIRHY